MNTILVVEDSFSQRECISYQLRWSGMNVIQASDGVEALEKIQGNSLDLVLLDIVMPRMDGYRLCRLLKANPATQNIPVVLLTGNGQHLAIHKGIKHAEAYVGKPWQPRELLDTIKQALLHANNSGSAASAQAWIQYGLLIIKMIEVYQSCADYWKKYSLQILKLYQLSLAAFEEALQIDPTDTSAAKYQAAVQQKWDFLRKNLERNKPCSVCWYYYGKEGINCAVHPSSRPQEICRDWELNQ